MSGFKYRNLGSRFPCHLTCSQLIVAPKVPLKLRSRFGVQGFGFRDSAAKRRSQIKQGKSVPLGYLEVLQG